MVVEAGWDVSSIQLRRDAHLWQMGSLFAVRVVILVKFYQADRNNHVRKVPNGLRMD